MDENAIELTRKLRDALVGLHEKSQSCLESLRDTEPSDEIDYREELMGFTEGVIDVVMALANDLDRLGDYLEELKAHLDGEGK